MIKFADILSEAKRVRLSPETLQTLKNVVDLIFRRRLRGFSKVTPITKIPITIADGTPGSVEIIVDPTTEHYAYIDSSNEDDRAIEPHDFKIVLNPNKIITKKGLYQTLYHEIMHVTDPTFSTKYSEKYWSTYDVESDEGYYGHMIEFRAFTNEFLEGLYNEFIIRRKRITNRKRVTELNNSLDNILNYFAKSEPLSPLSKEILKDMMGEESNFKLREFFKRFEQLLYGELERDDDYLDILQKVKENIGKEWKRFLNMLYDAYLEIKEKID